MRNADKGADSDVDADASVLGCMTPFLWGRRLVLNSPVSNLLLLNLLALPTSASRRFEPSEPSEPVMMGDRLCTMPVQGFPHYPGQARLGGALGEEIVDVAAVLALSRPTK